MPSPTDSEGRAPESPAPAARFLRGLLRLIVPMLFTAVAAGFGYAFAVLPTWFYARESARAETFGGVQESITMRRATASAYHFDSDVLEKFDEISWSVATVPTPFVGYGARPGQQHIATINRLQIRGAAVPALPKPPGVRRILITGASVAYGAGSSSDQRTIGGYLQHELSKRRESPMAEVFTLATPAWSSTHERIAIENRLSELEPDLVVSITGLADVFYGEKGQNVFWSRALTDQYYWNILNAAYRRAGLSDLLDPTDVGEEPVDPELVARRIVKNVRLASAALEMVGARYHVFLQPTITTTKKALSPRETIFLQRGWGFDDVDYHRSCYRAMDRALSSLELPNQAYTDMSVVFDALLPRNDVFTDGFHFGDRGNERMARFIADAIGPTR